MISELVPSQIHVSYANFIKILGFKNERNHFFRIKNAKIKAHRFFSIAKNGEDLNVFSTDAEGKFSLLVIEL